jgi:hypothetical protein
MKDNQDKQQIIQNIKIPWNKASGLFFRPVFLQYSPANMSTPR